MSRPIYEPSLPRADAENAYGNRQLFRRPAPSGEEGCPWVRRIIDASGPKTVVNDSEALMTYDDAGDETDPSVTGSVGWEAFWDFPDTARIRCLVQGYFIVSCQFLWTASFYTGETGLILNDGFSWPATTGTLKKTSGWPSIMNMMTHAHRYPVSQNVSIGVMQTSGIDREIEVGYLEIMRLCSYTGPDPGDIEE